MNAPTPLRLLLPVCVVVGMLCGMAVFLGAKVNNPPQVDYMDVEHWDLLGTPVPDVELQTLDGDPISSRHFAGQEHVIFFTDPGCGLCDEVYPALRAAAAEGLPVLMVGQQGLVEMRTKVAQEGLAFPVAYDSMGVLGDAMRVAGLPTAAWIDGAGAVVKESTGNNASRAVVQMAVAHRGAVR
jgi:peroxiredoxin